MVSYCSERFQFAQIYNKLKVELKTVGHAAKDGKSLKMSVTIISHAHTVYFLLYLNQTYYHRNVYEIQPHRSTFGGLKPHLGLLVGAVHLMFSNVFGINIQPHQHYIKQISIWERTKNRIWRSR